MFCGFGLSRSSFRIASTLFALAAAGLSSCGHTAATSILPAGALSTAHGAPRQSTALGTSIVSINVGGSATSTFAADFDGRGGTATSVTDTINVSAANTAPAAVYQTQRYGPMTYTIPGLVAGSPYVVRLHFAETWFGLGARAGIGQRQFNVAVNGATALANFDVYAAGGPDTAVVRDINATAGSGGQIVIALTNGSADNAMLNGIEILPGSVVGTAAAAIDVAGPAIGAFCADIDGSGGAVSSSPDGVDVSAANAAPMAVYQTQRYGPMTYVMPGFTPGSAHIVRLHFAELYWGLHGHGGGAGSRRFNVAINGASALSNVDVFALAGAADKALVIDTAANADGNGAFTIALTSGSADNAMLSAIQILPPVTTAAPAVNIGGPAAGSFGADTLPSGGPNGTIASTNAAIDVSAPNAASDAIYQTQRDGAFQRTIGGLSPGSPYTVRLHFAELYFGAGRAGTGQRMFNVSVNGQPVLSNFDVYAVAGSANKAVVRDFPTTADGNGTMTVALTNGAADNPMLSGIEIIAGSAAPVALASEMPRAADAFADSVGVNVHLSEYGTVYGNFGAIQALLAGAGVRHIRDGVTAGNSSICNEDQALAANGIHVDVISAWSMADNAWWLNCLGLAAESLEGINEWDLSNDANWAASLRADESNLALQFPMLPLVAPSLTSEAAFSTIGSLANIVAYGNAHVYFAGRNPGTSGWGSTDAYGSYGSLAWNLGIAGIVSGSKPIQVTESGYSDQLDQYAVPAVTRARYMLRLLLGNWNGGAARTYIYELADEGTPPFSHYGLVDGSGKPKPAYTAVAHLLGHLEDPGARFAPVPLRYNFAAPSTVKHMLLQKGNGTYELLFWNEVSEWNPDANAPQAAPPQVVQLSFASTPRAMQQSTFDDSGVLTTAPLASSSNLFLSAGPWPTIIDLTP